MAKEEIEIDEKDPVAEKAEAIGKEIGIEKEEVPDYDIQEEGDERIAKEREPEVKADKKDRPEVSNREKRQARKKKLNEKFNEKDATIQAQADKISQLEKWKNEVDGRLQGINKAEIDKAWNDSVTAFNAAEKDHAAAFTDGDGAKATAAMRVMYEAQKRIDQITALKSQVDKTPPATTPPIAVPQFDNAVMTKKAEWESRNEWFKLGSRDTNSQMATAISQAIANEGFDPSTDDYWDELDDRMQKFIPEKKAKDSDEDDYYQEEAIEEKPKRRYNPPVNGSSTRGDIQGKKRITLPTAYVNMLKANGKWDNEKVRNRILADRERIIKESQS